MISNFARFQEIPKQANSESYSSLSHVEPRNLPRSPVLLPRWSGPLDWFLHADIKKKGDFFAKYFLVLSLLFLYGIFLNTWALLLTIFFCYFFNFGKELEIMHHNGFKINSWFNVLKLIYSCSNINKTLIQISCQNWNVLFFQILAFSGSFN